VSTIVRKAGPSVYASQLRLETLTPVGYVSAGDVNSFQVQNKGLETTAPGYDRG